jgi:DNA invertase Pin-like site-specific DNA recombinase
MILKGRKGIPSHTKILQKQLKQIYSMHLEGVPQRQIAKKFKIHQGTVYKHIHKKYPIRPTIGEDNNKAILSKKKVIEMRLLYSEGNLSFKKIANLYGIEKSTAMRAIKGQTWKHV